MQLECLTTRRMSKRCALLQVHLLGRVPFEDVLNLQRRLLQQVENDREQSALIVCEHTPIITVGRLGSRAHIHYDPDELRLRGWQVRWINRGGGCMLHLPGQLAIYPIIALDRLGCNVQSYLDRLGKVILELLADYAVPGEVDVASGHVWAAGRPIAGLGAAVRRWVSYHGVVLNVHPDLDLQRRVKSAGGAPAMTSMERERHGPIEMNRVRERAIELVAEQFHCTETAIFFDNVRRV